MESVCELNKCAGCMACIDICPKDTITIKDSLTAYNAFIDEEHCIHCNACHRVCQVNHPAELRAPIHWYQGWAEDEAVRIRCSSGGAATVISSAFIENGGVVCSCTFKDGQFVFVIAERKKDLQQFVGSKYVKSNPAGVYKRIREILKSGRKVLFIGLPCQISAMRNYNGKAYDSHLYTVDLICHGSPSPQLLDRFLKQYNYSLKELRDIQFRVKAKFMVYGDHKGIITNGVSDRYSIAFLNSLTYTENCYSCYYAKKERVSDLTLGDSWGSELPIAEQKKGISLLLSQTEKGDELLKMADLHLEKVDLDMAIHNNHQLEHPSIEPEGRKIFFERLEKKSFNKLVYKVLPKACMKQDIKRALINLKIIKGGVY